MGEEWDSKVVVVVAAVEEEVGGGLRRITEKRSEDPEKEQQEGRAKGWEGGKKEQREGITEEQSVGPEKEQQEGRKKGWEGGKKLEEGLEVVEEDTREDGSEAALEEEEPEVVAEEQGRSIYFDEDQGIWKCRHCFWTYRVSNLGIGQIQKHKDYHYHGVIGVKTMSHLRSCSDSLIKGMETSNEMAVTEFRTIDQFVTDKRLTNGKADIRTTDLDIQDNYSVIENNQPKKMRAGILSNSEDDSGNDSSRIKPHTKGNEHVSLVHKIKSEIVEMDVERVLEEQETHDLFCPNCNSCITKRVILRKRKRMHVEHQHYAKREKIGLSAAGAETFEHDAEPDIFRCLSCFSFFFPTEGGFKLFQIFRKREGSEISQSLQQKSEKNFNQTASSFESVREEEKGSLSGNRLFDQSGILDNITGPQMPDQITFNSGTQLGDNKHELLRNKKNTSNASEMNHMVIQETLPDIGEELDLMTEEREESLNTRRNITSQLAMKDGPGKMDGSIQHDSKRDETVQPVEVRRVELLRTQLVSEKELSNESERRNIPTPRDQLPVNIHKKMGKDDMETQQVKVEEIGSSNHGAFNLEEAEVERRKRLIVHEIESHGDVILPVQCMVTPMTKFLSMKETSQSDKNFPVSIEPRLSSLGETQIFLGEQYAVEAGGSYQWDVLKSIVYGGLIESITSLGVVSSAAGADAATLNIIALGLANLVGGLFMLAHNLSELRSDQYKATVEKNEEGGRYWELLGRKGHFRLHATVAVLSYILVGILPPVIYGFSFRKSDNREYKLIAVASASLLCVALLAIGRAHVRKEPKAYMKTLSHYLVLGVTASGLSYVVGMLIKRLLEKLGLFVTLAPPLSGVYGSLEPRWAAY